RHAYEQIASEELLKPIGKALGTFKKHINAIARRWISGHTNARLEGLNGLFQAAQARARGYRNVENFITMIYLIAAPIQALLQTEIPQ
ncbi:transposase, partial [Desulfovulcanus sp.]